MAFATLSGVEIYDGSGFSRLYEVTGEPLILGNYKGFHHLYLSDADRYLWIKNNGTLHCIDLDTEVYVTDIPSLLAEKGISGQVDDFFGDSLGRIWIVCGNRLTQPDLGISINLGEDEDKLLDLIADGSSVSLFMKDGLMRVFPLSDNPVSSFASRAYPEEEESKFSGTSLIMETPESIYQIRNGMLGGFSVMTEVLGNGTRFLNRISGLTLLPYPDLLHISPQMRAFLKSIFLQVRQSIFLS